MPAQKKSAEQPRLWKDHISLERMRRFGELVQQIEPSFDVSEFVKTLISEKLEAHELKDRMALVARTLIRQLPADWHRVCEILERAAPQSGMWENFILTTGVEMFGLADPQRSLKALKLLTCHGTAESAIRPFILQDPHGVLRTLSEWASDPNEHVRRLVAEGLRPRGVWIMHLEFLKKDPAPALRIIGQLRADPSLYVRKAVANNLNDISKDHPALAVATARAWLKNGHADTRWVVERGLRSLVKQGNQDALALLGVKHTATVKVARFRITPSRVKRGGMVTLEASLILSGRKAEKVVVDFVVAYVSATRRVSRKVYKWSTRVLAPGSPLTLTRRLSLADRTTRKHYPGTHTITLLVNGRPSGTTRFRVVS